VAKLDRKIRNALYDVARVALIAALVPLALGISGDVFVVAEKVTRRAAVGVGAGAAMLGVLASAWFGFAALAIRRRRR
jgi:hypothetical protein